MHTVGTDLHLDPLAVLTHHRHVQRLIAVRFRRGYPVADALRMRTVDLRDGGVDHPALVFLAHRLVRREDDTNGHDVVHVLERALLLHHLLPNRVGGLDTRLERVRITHTVQPLTDRLTERLETLELAGLDGL